MPPESFVKLDWNGNTIVSFNLIFRWSSASVSKGSSYRQIFTKNSENFYSISDKKGGILIPH